jgi:hypothetical protein
MCTTLFVYLRAVWALLLGSAVFNELAGPYSVRGELVCTCDRFGQLLHTVMALNDSISLLDSCSCA